MSVDRIPSLWELARTAADAFEVAVRHGADGSGCDDVRYVRIREDAPIWVRNMTQAAHESIGGLMLPDDRRFALVSDACDFIAERADVPFDEIDHEFADDVDVYTSGLLDWAASHAVRLAYCDQARELGYVIVSARMDERLRLGQYMERAEVFAVVSAALLARADEIEYGV